ncbi:calcium-binding protein [Phaeobacter marinintestinus]|uniref:calcium-binding protein n=1 Tax=Falsiphaeobacter marinintestinus TaxID=1492905 RepID=UPI00164901C9|nr:calcium-binding protein [Phaeobacter marinintestinus]
MPNKLTLSVVDHKADDFIDWFNALELGLFSTSGMGTELTGTAVFLMDGGTKELRLNYVTIGDEIHVESLAGWDEGVAAFTAAFETPEPMGGTNWIDVLSTDVHAALLGDTAISVRGRGGDDWGTGFDFNDRFDMRDGNDAAYGGDGNDVLLGGRGMDLLIGGANNDRLIGGSDADLLIVGSGNDTANGGAGNDVMVFEGGVNIARGGLGSDIFIFDSFDNSGGGGPNVLRTRVMDFDPQDMLVFTSSLQECTISKLDGTLADLENGTLDHFQWRETVRGVEIRTGDAQVILRGAQAEDINLDMLLFTEQTAAEAVELFDSASSGGELGCAPGGDPYLTIMLENITRVDNGTYAFDTYGGDVSGFYIGAFPMV